MSLRVLFNPKEGDGSRVELPAKRARESTPLNITLEEIRAFDALRLVWRRCMTPKDLAVAFEVTFTCRYARVHMITFISEMYGLSQDQVLCLFRAFRGENVFITGPAGTGKSFIMMMIHEMLVGMNRSTVRTASTGTAAINVNGITIHSFCGIGINEHMRAATLVRWVHEENYIWENYRGLDTLMIDEISMLSDNQFNLIESIPRFMRDNHKQPAGGMQMIVCGDFLQLPPVKGAFAFTSDAWKRLNFKTCLLETSHRQTDLVWYDMLCKMRLGQLDGYSVNRLFSRVIDLMPTPPDNPDCTQLFSKRVVVEKVNSERLAQVAGPEYRLYAVTQVYKLIGPPGHFTQDIVHTFHGRSEAAEKLDNHFKVNHDIVLKPGCKVMIVQNDFDKGVSNGTVGDVVEITPGKVTVRVAGLKEPVEVKPVSWEYKNMGKRECYHRKQFPLILAYAITIHKAQGMGMANVKTSLRNDEIFQDGQGYVSLSRVQTLEGLQLVAFDARSVRANPQCLTFYREKEEEQEKRKARKPKYSFKLS